MNDGQDRNPFAALEPVLQRGVPMSRRNGRHAVQPGMTTDKPAVPRAGKIWPFPGLIFALISVNVAIVSLTIYLAGSDRSFAVEPDYYGRATRWNQTAEQRDRNTRLGWLVQMEPMHGGQNLVVNLKDSAGAPLSGAAIDLIAFHHADASHRLQTTLTEFDAGKYRSAETLTRPGLWQLNMTATHDGNVLTCMQSLVVGDKQGASP